MDGSIIDGRDDHTGRCEERFKNPQALSRPGSPLLRVDRVRMHEVAPPGVIRKIEVGHVNASRKTVGGESGKYLDAVTKMNRPLAHEMRLTAHMGRISTHR